jgi:hypothetical protein
MMNSSAEDREDASQIERRSQAAPRTPIMRRPPPAVEKGDSSTNSMHSDHSLEHGGDEVEEAMALAVSQSTTCFR